MTPNEPPMNYNEMTAGPEMDRLVAERVMGWRWHQPPKHDYNGPLPEQGEVLVPPGFTNDGFQWPPKGVVPVGFFCNAFQPSTNITHAWEVVEKIGGMFFSKRNRFAEELVKQFPVTGGGFIAWPTAIMFLKPVNICRAALLATASPKGQR